MTKSKRGTHIFERKNQIFVNITEETANVGYIAMKAREKFGNISLVAGNGLPIEDEDGTRGERQLFSVVETKLISNS